MSYLFLRERLGRAARLVIPVGIIGAVWVIFRGDLDALLALGLGKGDTIFLAANFSMGCYMPLVKILHRASPWRG